MSTDESPSATASAAPSTSAPELWPGWNGRRLAGLALVTIAVLTALEALLFPAPDAGANLRSILSYALDAAIGGTLLARNHQLLLLGIVRVAFGALTALVVHGEAGEIFVMLLQLTGSAGLLGLLVGEASLRRIHASLVLLVLFGCAYTALLAFALLVPAP